MADIKEPASKKQKRTDNSILSKHDMTSCETDPFSAVKEKNGFSMENKNNILQSKVSSDNLSLIPNFNIKVNGVEREGVNNDHQRKILIERHALPIFPVRRRLIEQLKKNDTVIIIGETGSGKTTQIPQYLHEERLEGNSRICVTQPRRVAAITIAKRVSEEMNVQLGSLVGYSVRFEELISLSTKIKYMTDGMLLREAIIDPLLMKYIWVILDEAHERTISTDVLFGIIKEAQEKRKKMKNELKIIIMSATMDVDHFSQYFNNAPVLYIEGRQYQIDMFYANENHADYVLACMSTVFQIHKEAPAQHDILMFLTGQEEIDGVTQTIRQLGRDNSLAEYPKLRVYPFYAALPPFQQLEIFRKTAPGERKVIICTNIAETSITIPGIRYVVDSGRAKIRTYFPQSGFDVLKVKKISQAQAWQRTGRAGRESAGTCYRVFTLDEFNNMPVNPVPEILRTNLASVILQLLALGIKNILNFNFIDKPNVENVKMALENLKNLGAIKMDSDNLELLEIGKKMACFPLEPQYSKIILSGPDFGCTEEVLSIISVLSSETIFINPSGKKDQATAARSKFSSVEGDHIRLLKIFRAFKSCNESKLWCRDNFLNYRNLQYAVEVRKQLAAICQRCNITRVSCQQNFDALRKCLLVGLFTHVAELQLGGKYITLESRQAAAIHPTSIIFGGKPAYILFTELVHTGKTYMHINSVVDASWLVEIAPDYFRKKHIKH